MGAREGAYHIVTDFIEFASVKLGAGSNDASDGDESGEILNFQSSVKKGERFTGNRLDGEQTMISHLWERGMVDSTSSLTSSNSLV
ncbi:hypothetical protein L2E82_06370 [Cichorium intybus]|uniref:Uncharacterized protein n=1 Tax=Cichorium intybus TaxID=13427 RepID=A0ACB9HB24_CICIN|nr:hypothetical protein L2E82_06370 [Cichorium intybus]